MTGLPVSTLPALIEAFAPHDGRSVAALRAVATALREGGLVACGARGNGAIRMGPDDAAAIALAALWTDSPIASPRAVEVLSSLKRKPAPPASVGRFVDAIVRLPDLGETLAALIEHGRYVQAELAGFDIEITVTRPTPSAVLALIDDHGRRRVIAEWSVDAAKLTRGFYRAERLRAVDRRHSSTITGRTLFALADCIGTPERERA